MIERKGKEKIETKGAYSHDLHEAIRDVRRAFASNATPRQVQSRLNALFDICAPEIREAIQVEWNEIDKKYQKQLERIENAKYEFTGERRLHGWNKRRYDGERYDVFRTYFEGSLPLSGYGQPENTTRDSLLRQVWDEIYRERFRACIDCLDRHGELRKWREVEYGRL